MDNVTPTEEIEEVLSRLLAMAWRYREEGNNQQAADLFFMLVEHHAHSYQADAAKEQLIALAEEYERGGAQHMARGIYERLIAVKG